MGDEIALDNGQLFGDAPESCLYAKDPIADVHRSSHNAGNSAKTREQLLNALSKIGRTIVTVLLAFMTNGGVTELRNGRKQNERPKDR